MGRLVYDGSHRFFIDDRTLAHLQIVIGDKLRRGEPFTFTWPQSLEEGGGRVAVWMNASSSLVFRFDSSGPHRINRAWLDALFLAAHSPLGLTHIEEPGLDGEDRG